MLEPPQQGGSNLYPQSMFRTKILETSYFFPKTFSKKKLYSAWASFPYVDFGTITKNLPMQYTEIFGALIIGNFQLKNYDIFLIFAQNIDCGYTLELPG